ncbi:hypothetical protein [Robinsoniella peoriensis]|uniref:hypothetical protein n=1 Tax=Robinsoniella peoriensis TaxID=180332 RepID=UPI00159EFD20|nr:hypothetical protein [Robinsoniella peoriensis]
MLEDFSNEVIKEEQAKLNQLYDAFTAKYGLIKSRGNALAFSEDNSYYLLCSLEDVDDEKVANVYLTQTPLSFAN